MFPRCFKYVSMVRCRSTQTLPSPVFNVFFFVAVVFFYFTVCRQWSVTRKRSWSLVNMLVMYHHAVICCKLLTYMLMLKHVMFFFFFFCKTFHVCMYVTLKKVKPSCQRAHLNRIPLFISVEN